jgi:hypothetical protein
MMGQKMASVTKEYFVSGNHSISYNISNQIPGLYISKIKTGNIVTSKPIIIK